MQLDKSIQRSWDNILRGHEVQGLRNTAGTLLSVPEEYGNLRILNKADFVNKQELFLPQGSETKQRPELPEMIVGGYASPQVVDKEKHLITKEAMQADLPRFLAHPHYRNVMVVHTNIQVGEVLPEWTHPGTGEVYKTKVDEVGLFAVVKIRTDPFRPAIVDQVIKDIDSGELAAFSISGDAPYESRKYQCADGTCFWVINEIEHYEITLCQKGVNQDAKYAILSKAAYCQDGACPLPLPTERITVRTIRSAVAKASVYDAGGGDEATAGSIDLGAEAPKPPSYAGNPGQPDGGAGTGATGNMQGGNEGADVGERAGGTAKTLDDRTPPDHANGQGPSTADELFAEDEQGRPDEHRRAVEFLWQHGLAYVAGSHKSRSAKMSMSEGDVSIELNDGRAVSSGKYSADQVNDAVQRVMKFVQTGGAEHGPMDLHDTPKSKHKEHMPSTSAAPGLQSHGLKGQKHRHNSWGHEHEGGRHGPMGSDYKMPEVTPDPEYDEDAVFGAYDDGAEAVGMYVQMRRLVDQGKEHLRPKLEAAEQKYREASKRVTELDPEGQFAASPGHPKELGWNRDGSGEEKSSPLSQPGVGGSHRLDIGAQSGPGPKTRSKSGNVSDPVFDELQLPTGGPEDMEKHEDSQGSTDHHQGGGGQGGSEVKPDVLSYLQYGASQTADEARQSGSAEKQGHADRLQRVVDDYRAGNLDPEEAAKYERQMQQFDSAGREPVWKHEEQKATDVLPGIVSSPHSRNPGTITQAETCQHGCFATVQDVEELEQQQPPQPGMVSKAVVNKGGEQSFGPGDIEADLDRDEETEEKSLTITGTAAAETDGLNVRKSAEVHPHGRSYAKSDDDEAFPWVRKFAKNCALCETERVLERALDVREWRSTASSDLRLMSRFTLEALKNDGSMSYTSGRWFAFGTAEGGLLRKDLAVELGSLVSMVGKHALEIGQTELWTAAYMARGQVDKLTPMTGQGAFGIMESLVTRLCRAGRIDIASDMSGNLLAGTLEKGYSFGWYGNAQRTLARAASTLRQQEADAPADMRTALGAILEDIDQLEAQLGVTREMEKGTIHEEATQSELDVAREVAKDTEINVADADDKLAAVGARDPEAALSAEPASALNDPAQQTMPANVAVRTGAPDYVARAEKKFVDLRNGSDVLATMEDPDKDDIEVNEDLLRALLREGTPRGDLHVVED